MCYLRPVSDGIDMVNLVIYLDDDNNRLHINIDDTITKRKGSNFTPKVKLETDQCL